MKIRSRQEGFSIIELMVVLGIIGAIALMAIPNMLRWADAERVKSAARSIADAMTFARSEAIRTGNNHLVVMGMALGASAPVVVVDDGPPATANCTIAANEVVLEIPAEAGVNWGTSAAGGTAVPSDSGNLTGNAATGWSFADAGKVDSASWLLFQPDGIPRLFTAGGGNCTAIGNPGEGGGGVYLNSGGRDYAVVLRPLGTVRVHKWERASGNWSN